MNNNVVDVLSFVGKTQCIYVFNYMFTSLILPDVTVT